MLETARLLLRPFEETDLDAFARINANPDVTRYLGGPADRAAVWRQIAVFIGHMQLRGYSILAVTEKASGALVGRSGPWFPEGWPMLEVGWVIDRARWGEGFATEAGRASLDYCFDVLGVTEVCSIIRPDNDASARVAQKLGARPERRLADFFGAAADLWIHRRHRPDV